MITFFEGLSCYSCLEVNPLKTNERASALHDALVNFGFGGVDPGSCASPSMSQCSVGEACFVLQMTAELTSKTLKCKIGREAI